MKRLNLLCCFAIVGLAVWLLGERRAWSRADQANQNLRQQLSQMDALLADNRRLLALVPESGPSSPPNQGSDSVSAMTEPAKELLRLRGEAEALREENKTLETLQEDTRRTRAAALGTATQNTSSNPVQRQNSTSNSSGSKLQILRAVYGTDNAQVDVTDELQDRIRGDQLKAIASNNIKGDPEFGKTKQLTVEYSYGGVTFTNQFTEGAFVQLPPPDTQ